MNQKQGGGVHSVAVSGEREGEAAAALEAFKSGDPRSLPEHARRAWERMFKSTLRYLEYAGEQVDDEAKRYAASLGWRAVRLKYRLGTTDKAAPAAAGAKFLHAGTLESEDGSAYVVHVAGSRSADVLYERTLQLPLHSAPGASVLVGLGTHNHRNILSVRVPKALVSSQPGGVGAVEFVRRKWDEVWRTGKGEDSMYVLTRAKRVAALAASPRVVPFVGYGGRTGSGTKFVTDPRQATKRIAYGVAYPAYKMDLQGEFADEYEVEAMAYGFMKALMTGKSSPGEMHARWAMPDGTPVGFPVESFLVRRGDPDFPDEGDWVVATEVHPDVWKRIETRERRGYSIGGRWATNPVARRAD